MAISTIGTNSRNYIDLDAWLADLPATLVQQEVAEMYNDSEFTTSSGIVISGITTTPTFNMIIRPASGEAFNDTEQALRYNQANGVGIRKTTNYGTVLYVNGVENVTVDNVQIVGGMFRTQPIRLAGAHAFLVKNSLLQGTSNSPQFRVFNTNDMHVINNAIISTANEPTADGIQIIGSNARIINNTIIALFPADSGIARSYGGYLTAVVKNNTIFNFSTPINAGAWDTTNTNFNATDSASVEGGANNLTSLTAADQFEDIASVGTLDLRLKAGNSLDGAGTPESSFTNDLDVFFNARSATTPSIGAYETASGGGGIEVAPLNVNSSSLSINPSITFSSSLNLSPLQVDSSSISINPSISFSSALNLSPDEANSLSVSVAPTILFSGALELSPVNVNSAPISIDPTIQYSSSLILTPNEVDTSSLALSPTIEYTSALVVAPQSVNSSSISINPQIEFKSIINLDPETVSSISIALNPTITTGKVQNIGNVTAGFKDSGISVKYSINNITVNFK